MTQALLQGTTGRLFRRRNVLVVLSATIALIFGVATPAFASSRYNFTADYSYKLTSGSWQQNATGAPSFYFQCTAGSGQQYTVQLGRYVGSGIFEPISGATITKTCSTKTAQTGSWSSQPPGAYKFQLTKSNNGVHVVGSGYITHS